MHTSTHTHGNILRHLAHRRIVHFETLWVKGLNILTTTVLYHLQEITAHAPDSKNWNLNETIIQLQTIIKQRFAIIFVLESYAVTTTYAYIVGHSSTLKYCTLLSKKSPMYSLVEFVTPSSRWGNSWGELKPEFSWQHVKYQAENKFAESWLCSHL